MNNNREMNANTKLRGQGSLEYLLLIAGVVLVAGVVIFILFSAGNETKNTIKEITIPWGEVTGECETNTDCPTPQKCCEKKCKTTECTEENCNDSNPETQDTCLNPGECNAACQFIPKNQECTASEDCPAYACFETNCNADGKCEYLYIGCDGDEGEGGEEPECGNSICEVGETYENCETDCPAPTQCGNSECEEGETETCPEDCVECHLHSDCVDDDLTTKDRCINSECSHEEIEMKNLIYFGWWK